MIIKSSEGQTMEIKHPNLCCTFCPPYCLIWVPVIKSEISFNKSFMITFKSFFIALFFSGVIFAGTEYYHCSDGSADFYD